MQIKEGLKIKIYIGSIICLNVDCIVNVLNENLMYGGGVVVVIFKVVGYLFDLESKKYVEDNGYILVGSCCVIFVGILLYRCVIYIVGFRWGDYRDKNWCLQDFRVFVEVIFREVDKMGMKIIVILLISFGKF